MGKVTQYCETVLCGKYLSFLCMRLPLCTKILEVNLFAFAYRLFHEDFSALDGVTNIRGYNYIYMFHKYNQNISSIL